MYDVAIIGCGVIGAAAAYALSRYDNKVVILEAENDVADCTTKANSAILHAGYDPAPGTKMARLNVRGVELAKEICAKLDVPYKQCGSLVLALAESELPHLQHLYENGVANGVPGLKILSKEETLALEPNLSANVCGALWAPSAAIVSPWEYALAMTEVAVRNGVELRRSCKVENAEKIEGGYRLEVKILGPEKEDAAALSKISGVGNVESTGERDAGAFRYLIDTKGGADIRRDVFRLCCEKNYPLLGMSAAGTDLESVFIRLVDRADAAAKG